MAERYVIQLLLVYDNENGFLRAEQTLCFNMLESMRLHVKKVS